MESYDYVVIGAGSAGCVVAARLSEDGDRRVALIEAGGDNREEHVLVPGLYGLLFKTKHDWDYDSEPEPHLGGRTVYLPRGRGLGGSSAINGMVYVRGHADDFDAWQRAGHAGWGFADVLPYFLRSEGNVRGASARHGADGPLAVSDRAHENEVAAAWVESALAAGHPRNADFNGEAQDGIGWYQVTVRDGVRCSTSAAFLEPALARPNLDVLTDALVTRIVIDGYRATGVELERHGEPVALSASREVIVSAGAYNSPQLLMLSGVGPRAHLDEIGVGCVADLPVGDGLQDHPGVFTIFRTQARTGRTEHSREILERWRATRDGPLASNVVAAGGFFRTRAGLARPDIQMTVVPTGWSDEGLGLMPGEQFVILQWLLRPLSRGLVRLRSELPSAKPRITHNPLASAPDRRAMADGLRLNMAIAETEPLRALRSATVRAPSSLDDRALDAYLRANVLSSYHATSPCAMGTVVDRRLRVHGIDALRVVDASVMPTIVAGNPHAAVVMIAERAAGMIRTAR